jgi:hypothetical protein
MQLLMVRSTEQRGKRPMQRYFHNPYAFSINDEVVHRLSRYGPIQGKMLRRSRKWLASRMRKTRVLPGGTRTIRGPSRRNIRIEIGREVGYEFGSERINFLTSRAFWDQRFFQLSVCNVKGGVLKDAFKNSLFELYKLNQIYS